MATKPPDGCHLPSPAPLRDSEIYARFRNTMIRAHCAAKRGHLCCGAITITRDTITMNCPLCGDCRMILDGNTLHREPERMG